MLTRRRSSDLHHVVISALPRVHRLDRLGQSGMKSVDDPWPTECPLISLFLLIACHIAGLEHEDWRRSFSNSYCSSNSLVSNGPLHTRSRLGAHSNLEKLQLISKITKFIFRKEKKITLNVASSPSLMLRETGVAVICGARPTINSYYAFLPFACNWHALIMVRYRYLR